MTGRTGGSRLGSSADDSSLVGTRDPAMPAPARGLRLRRRRCWVAKSSAEKLGRHTANFSIDENVTCGIIINFEKSEITWHDLLLWKAYSITLQSHDVFTEYLDLLNILEEELSSVSDLTLQNGPLS
ncbi:hypothetical protein ZEAMMB73_Zm00001d017058 [Zea mays]|uniref:Uncharacterized protein n=1 Tax=Zea mays TaxID=4577 RepID=A0A1D6HBZ2_MAIZE|nr:hypothetical protein ZEAMMB73_Zm00001d017058 [Zea mays]